MTDKFQNKYRIASARAPWHGYDGGVYFVTICTKNREHYFGEIIGGGQGACAANTDEPQMQLSEIGKYATCILENITEHCPYAEIPLFVVMPDHIHLIVIIDGNKTPYQRRTENDMKRVAHHRISGACTAYTGNATDAVSMGKQMQDIDKTKGWLSIAIGGMKSAVTKYANAHQIPFGWQTRFYDRIVRDPSELNRIAKYIENNVAKWQFKELNMNEKQND